jgi:hypothetical protein
MECCGMLKRWTFWCLLFSVLIVTCNLAGLDDKNLLIFLTNPLNWILENEPQWRSVTPYLIHVSHLVFWGALGWGIDLVVRKWNQRKRV